MALNNDARLFSGGNERIDIRPHIQLYAQLKQREQARNDAFDEYMRNINMKINPAGMRYQDMPAFESGLKKMQDFGIQNREAIQNPRKDGGVASMQFQQLYQQQLNRAASSKMASEGLKPFIEVNTDPKKARLLNKEKAMKAVQAHDQPQEIQDETGEFVPNPNFRPFNPSDLEFKNDPFDQNKFDKLFEKINRNEIEIKEDAIDPNTMKQKVTKTSRFDQKAKDQIGEIAVTELHENPSFQDVVKSLNPDDYKDFYKKEFGTEMKDEGDLAAAYALKRRQDKIVEIEDKENAYARQKAIAGLNHAYRLGEKQFAHALGQADEDEANLWAKDNVETKIANAMKTTPIVYTDSDGNKKLGHDVPLDTYWRKAFAKPDGTYPAGMRLTAEGQLQPVFVEYENGVPKKDPKTGRYNEDFSSSTPHTVEDAILAISGKAGTKQLNKEASGNIKGSKKSTPAKRGVLD